MSLLEVEFERDFPGDLPVELWAMILGFVGIDWFPCLARVSRTFYCLTKDSLVLQQSSVRVSNGLALWHNGLWKRLIQYIHDYQKKYDERFRVVSLKRLEYKAILAKIESDRNELLPEARESIEKHNEAVEKEIYHCIYYNEIYRKEIQMMVGFASRSCKEFMKLPSFFLHDRMKAPKLDQKLSLAIINSMVPFFMRYEMKMQEYPTRPRKQLMLRDKSGSWVQNFSLVFHCLCGEEPCVSRLFVQTTFWDVHAAVQVLVQQDSTKTYQLLAKYPRGNFSEEKVQALSQASRRFSSVHLCTFLWQHFKEINNSILNHIGVEQVALYLLEENILSEEFVRLLWFRKRITEIFKAYEIFPRLFEVPIDSRYVYFVLGMPPVPQKFQFMMSLDLDSPRPTDFLYTRWMIALQELQQTKERPFEEALSFQET